MAQFDVFANPIAAARHAYPFVVAMQSDLTINAVDQLAAPLAPRESMPKVAGRLTPKVVIDGIEYVVLVPALSGLRSRDLQERRGSIASSRSELLAAIDYLFFGV
jgi:toxin CcdB